MSGIQMNYQFIYDIVWVYFTNTQVNNRKKSFIFDLKLYVIVGNYRVSPQPLPGYMILRSGLSDFSK